MIVYQLLGSICCSIDRQLTTMNAVDDGQNVEFITGAKAPLEDAGLVGSLSLDPEFIEGEISGIIN